MNKLPEGFQEWTGSPVTSNTLNGFQEWTGGDIAGPAKAEDTRRPASSDQDPPRKPASVDEFVQQISPIAQRIAQKIGAPVDAVIGQLGLETGWGKSVIPGTNNYGNIKDTSGKGVAATDNMTGSRDRYRQYATPEEFADDYAKLVGTNPRYKGAVGAKDAQGFFTGLKQGGYAEDPNYVQSGVAASRTAAESLKKAGFKQESSSLPDMTGIPKWSEISTSEKFSKLPDAEKARTKSAYFDELIAPYVAAEGLDVASEKARFLNAGPSAKPTGSMMDSLKDAGKDALGAIASGGNQLLGAANFVSRYTPAGIADAVVSKLSGRESGADVLAGKLNEDRASIAATQSDEMKRQRANIDSASGFLDTMKALYDNPRAVANFVGEQLPQFGLMGKVGKAAMAGKTGTEAIVAAATANQILSGVMSAADAGTSAEQAMYAYVKQQGGTDQEAREKAARARSVAGAVGAVIGTAVGKIGAKAESGVLARMIGNDAAGLTVKEAAKKVPTLVAKEFSEEALDEGLASQMASNIGEISAGNKDRGAFDDVGKSAAIGGTLGMVMGGGLGAVDTIGAIGRNQGQSPQADNQSPQVPPQPPQAHPTSEVADAVVRDLAAAAGMDVESLIPAKTLPAQPAAVEPIAEVADAQGDTGIADQSANPESRELELWLKSSDVGLSPDEQAELSALQNTVPQEQTQNGIEQWPAASPNVATQANDVQGADVQRSDGDQRRDMGEGQRPDTNAKASLPSVGEDLALRDEGPGVQALNPSINPQQEILSEPTPVEAQQAAPQGFEPQQVQTDAAPGIAPWPDPSQPVTQAQTRAPSRTVPDDLLGMLNASGGISSSIRSDIDQDAKGRPGLYRASGRNIDEIGALMAEYGYLTPVEAADGNVVLGMLRRAVGGERIMTAQGIERAQQREDESRHRAGLVAKATELGVNPKGKSIAKLESAIQQEITRREAAFDARQQALILESADAEQAIEDVLALFGSGSPSFQWMADKFAEISERENADHRKSGYDSLVRAARQALRKWHADNAGVEAVIEKSLEDGYGSTENPFGPSEGVAGEAEPSAAAEGARPGGVQSSDGRGQGFALETQTEQTLAEKVARENDQSLADKQTADAQREGFTLDAQPAQESRSDSTADMFGGPSVADFRQTQERERQQAERPAAGVDLFSQTDVSKKDGNVSTSAEPVQNPAETEQVAGSQDSPATRTESNEKPLDIARAEQPDIIAQRFPDVADVQGMDSGLGGIVEPRRIAEGKMLYREVGAGGLHDLLGLDGQADLANFFVTDNPDLALGQGGNKGVQVEFRPNSLSGAEHKKPGTGDIAGREYRVDLRAPRAVQSVTLKASDLKLQRGIVRRVLASEFSRTDLPDGRIRFDRKGLEPSGPMFSRSSGSDTGPGPITKLWKAFADSDAFQTAKTDATDIQAALDDVLSEHNRNVELENLRGDGKNKGKPLFLSAERVEELAVPKEGRTAPGFVIRDQNLNKVAFVYDADSTRPFFEIGNDNVPLGSGLGAIYQALFGWINSNGKTLRKDPRGLTTINELRRTEQSITAILKYNNSGIVEPDGAQFAGLLTKSDYDSYLENGKSERIIAELERLKALYWGPDNASKTSQGVTNARINNLALASAALALKRVPRIFKGSVLDSRGNVRTRGDNGEVAVLRHTDKSGKKAAEVDGSYLSGVGYSTRQRALATLQSIYGAKIPAEVDYKELVRSGALQAFNAEGSPAVHPRAGMSYPGQDALVSSGQVPLLSKTQEQIAREIFGNPNPKSTVDQIAKELSGEGSLGSNIKVIQSALDLPTNERRQVFKSSSADIGLQAVFFPDSGRVYLIADNIEPGEALSALLHDGGVHAGLYGMLGERGINSLAAQIKDWSINSLGKEEGRIAKLALDRIPDNTSLEHRNEEAVAYFVTEAVKAGHGDPKPTQSTAISRWFAKLWKMVESAIQKLGADPSKLTVDDVVALARGALERVKAGEIDPRRTSPQASGPHASRSPNVTEKSVSVGVRTSPKREAKAATTPTIPSGDTSAAFELSDPTRWDKFMMNVQDKQINLKRVQQAISKTKAIQEQFDAYQKEELYHGRVAARSHKFLDVEMRPLLAEMQMGNISMDELDAYLWARHAKERNAQIRKINPEMEDGGSGLTDAQADDYFAGRDVIDSDNNVIIKGLSARHVDRLSRLAKKVDAITAGTKQVLLQYGLETKETISAWEGAYQHYVPLQREDMDGGPSIGQGFSVKGSSSKRAMGSSRKVTNILANLAMQREAAITRGEKNRVALSLYGLAIQNKNPDFWEVDRAPAKRIINKSTGLVEDAIDTNYKSKDNVLVVRVGGEDRAVVFNERNERAMDMVAMLKNLDSSTVGEITNLVGHATRYFSSINTQYNPVFGLFNGLRDVQSATLNLSTTPLAGKQLAVLRAIPGAMRAIWKIERKGKSGTEYDKIYEDMKMSGGTTGYREVFRMGNDRAKALQKEIDGASAGFSKKAFRSLLEVLDHYNTAIENGTRLAAYKVAISKGISTDKAASIAKNLTVNFNRKGKLAQQVGPWYAFFNAAVQGTARTHETLAGPAGKRILIGGVTLGIMQAILAMSCFDDDEWEAIPEFVKQRNYIIPLGDGDYLAFPMPLGFNVLPNIGRIFSEIVSSKGKNTGAKIADLLSVLLDNANPLGSSTFLQTLSPTVLDPIVALIENKNFAGRPIAREDFNPLRPTPGFKRAKDTSSHASRGLSKAINYATGGTDYTPGGWSPTPDQLDYIFGTLTGGVGREFNRVYSSIELKVKGEKVPLNKIPVYGKFVGTTRDDLSVSAKYWNNVKELAVVSNELNGRRMEGVSSEDYRNKHPEASLALTADNLEKYIAEIRAARHKAEFNEKLTEEERTAKLKDLDEKITRQMTAFNTMVAQAKKGFVAADSAADDDEGE